MHSFRLAGLASGLWLSRAAAATAGGCERLICASSREAIQMPIGPDVLVFVSASKALLQALRHQSLNDEERAELECCLRQLTELLREDPERHAA